MKDAFNEGLLHITHFVALYTFIRGPQTLLTFIRHLTLINNNLIKQKTKKSLLFRIKFKQFRSLSAYSKLQCVFTLYVHLSL